VKENKRVMGENTFDRIREFWDRKPCNVANSAAAKGTIEYYDDLNRHRYFVEPHIPGFAKFPFWGEASILGKANVLDVGCGLGTDTISFAKEGACVTAVDISPHSLELAMKGVELYGLGDRVEFYEVNIEEMSQKVPVKSYDLIYSFGVLHHTPNPRKAVEEMIKYANRLTVFKIMLYHRYSWKRLWGFLKYRTLDPARYSESQLDSPITDVYSKREARKLLKGLKILDMKVNFIFPYKISEYKDHRYVKEWYFRYMPNFLFRILEKIFGWHLLISAVKDR